MQVLTSLAASGVDENEETEETINSAIGRIKLKRRVETCFERRTPFLLEEVAIHSLFNAISGSTFAARNAGIKQANKTTIERPSPTATKTLGS